MKLAEVVALWRETLDPATSLAAAHLAARVPHETWPDKDSQAAWLERARTPGHEVELVRVFDFVKIKAAHVVARLDTMATWQPHPVVTRWLVEVFARQTRAPILDGQKCFRRVFNLLATHIDLEGAARFRAWIGTHQARIAASTFGAEFFDKGMQRVLEKAADRLTSTRALTASERDALDSAGLLVAPDAPPAEPTLDSLFAMVYAAPNDDAPRAVLADFLQGRGDPRGEFIALDLLTSPTPEQRKRRNALLKAHGKEWFPTALHRLVNRNATYERGFLAKGELVGTRTPIELSTFRELAVSGRPPDFDHPVFRGIEAWRGIAPHVQIATPQPRITRLGLSGKVSEETLLNALRAEIWPSITELSIEWAVDRWGDWWTDDELPSSFDVTARKIASRFPALRQLEIARVVTFRRDDRMRLEKIHLPRDLAFRLVTYYASRWAPARDRWFGWLAEHEVPILVEGLAEQLRPLLPPNAAARVQPVK